MSVSQLLRWSLLAAAASISLVHPWDASAAETEYHPWGTFEVGSWKEVRVVTETLDGQGRVANAKTTVTRTTLTAATESSFTLRVDSSLQVAGKLLRANPETLQQGYYGEPAGHKVEIGPVSPGEVTISGRTYPVLIRRITDTGDGENKVITDYTSENVPPFLLKREIAAVAGDATGGKHETVVEVIALEMPYKVLTEVKTSSYVKTLHTRRDGGSSVTVEVHCLEVPGAVVAHSVNELDAAGKVVRRSTLELVDYRIVRLQSSPPATDDDRPRILHRFRRRRS